MIINLTQTLFSFTSDGNWALLCVHLFTWNTLECIFVQNTDCIGEIHLGVIEVLTLPIPWRQDQNKKRRANVYIYLYTVNLQEEAPPPRPGIFFHYRYSSWQLSVKFNALDCQSGGLLVADVIQLDTQEKFDRIISELGCTFVVNRIRTN